MRARPLPKAQQSNQGVHRAAEVRFWMESRVGASEIAAPTRGCVLPAVDTGQDRTVVIPCPTPADMHTEGFHRAD